MKVSYNEDLANHIDPESCVGVGNRVGEALTGGDAGRVLMSREKIKPIWGADAVDGSGRQHRIDRYREIDEDPARSKTLCMHPSTSCGSRIVPKKPTNKEPGAPSSAEWVEGRGLAEGNSGEQNRDRAQYRASLQSALTRIRQAACRIEQRLRV